VCDLIYNVSKDGFMATISSTSVYNLELSDEEYRIILRSLSKTAYTEKELDLRDYFATMLNGPAVEEFHEAILNGLQDDLCGLPGRPSSTDFKPGDKVVLIKDLHTARMVFSEGTVFEVHIVYEDDLLVSTDGLELIISKEHFVLEQHGPNMDVLIENQFSNLLDRFSK